MVAFTTKVVRVLLLYVKVVNKRILIAIELTLTVMKNYFSCQCPIDWHATWGAYFMSQLNVTFGINDHIERIIRQVVSMVISRGGIGLLWRHKRVQQPLIQKTFTEKA